MKKRIDCDYRSETSIGDFCEFEKKMCESINEDKCYDLYVQRLIAKLLDDTDELAHILDDSFLATFGNYLEALRNGF